MEADRLFTSELENGLNKQLNVFTATLSPDSPEQPREEGELNGSEHPRALTWGARLLPWGGVCVQRLGNDFVNNANILKEETKQNKTSGLFLLMLDNK